MEEETALVVLLGGSGYIGLHIMLALHGQLVSLNCDNRRRFQVVIVDKQVPLLAAIQHAEKCADGLPVIFRSFDLESQSRRPRLPRVPYCGIMLAALKDVNEGETMPYDYIRTNTTLCVNSMQYLTELGVPRLIQASSSSVYHARASDGQPIGVYGYTKRISEDICVRLMAHDQRLLIARYMNPIGSHPEIEIFASIGVCSRLAKMKPREIFINRGDCIRDYIHITDLAAFHLDALRSWEDTLFSENDETALLDVGTGVRTSVSDLVEAFSGRAAVVVPGIRQHHEGYDTVGVTDNTVRLLPTWHARKKRDLASSLADYKPASSLASAR